MIGALEESRIPDALSSLLATAVDRDAAARG
jgi:hypothetical protein